MNHERRTHSNQEQPISVIGKTRDMLRSLTLRMQVMGLGINTGKLVDPVYAGGAAIIAASLTEASRPAIEIVQPRPALASTLDTDDVLARIPNCPVTYRFVDVPPQGVDLHIRDNKTKNPVRVTDRRTGAPVSRIVAEAQEVVANAPSNEEPNDSFNARVDSISFNNGPAKDNNSKCGAAYRVEVIMPPAATPTPEPPTPIPATATPTVPPTPKPPTSTPFPPTATPEPVPTSTPNAIEATATQKVVDGLAAVDARRSKKDAEYEATRSAISLTATAETKLDNANITVGRAEGAQHAREQAQAAAIAAIENGAAIEDAEREDTNVRVRTPVVIVTPQPPLPPNYDGLENPNAGRPAAGRPAAGGEWIVGNPFEGWDISSWINDVRLNLSQWSGELGRTIYDGIWWSAVIAIPSTVIGIVRHHPWSWGRYVGTPVGIGFTISGIQFIGRALRWW